MKLAKYFLLMMLVSNPAFAAFVETQVVANLNQPTAMAFAPDGRLFVAEKTGKLRVIKNGVLLPTPFLTVNVNSVSERGLLGVAFDPHFATNKHVYVYYTKTSPIKNKVSRFTANGDIGGNELTLIDNIASDAGNHNAGHIAFGPKDGLLYIATGDGGSTPANSQNLGNLSGKILRLNKNGTIPHDNPFVGMEGVRPEIWAYGLRNPFSFAVDSKTGKLHINDVGQNTWEEINLGIAGANYGWPICEGPKNTGVGTCTSNNFTYPIHAYGHGPGRAITGGAFYRGQSFLSEWDGVYFYADYIGNFINYLDINNKSFFFRPATSPVALQVGPDGALYYASIGAGSVRKIQEEPVGGNGCLKSPTNLRVE